MVKLISMNRIRRSNNQYIYETSSVMGFLRTEENLQVNYFGVSCFVTLGSGTQSLG